VHHVVETAQPSHHGFVFATFLLGRIEEDENPLSRFPLLVVGGFRGGMSGREDVATEHICGAVN
jgi:hypothetical protein